MLPTSHYDKSKADRAVTFIQNLKHTKGRWANVNFELLPWQEQIVRDIFGVVKANGKRQFSTAFVEISKKNGKSELAAAIALYLLYADNEASAEVYGAASDRQQASIVFDVAKNMAEMCPAIMKRSKIMTAQKRLVNYSNNGFYQVLSAEVGCVTEDTIIQMNDGTLKTANQVQKGDIILAYNGLTPVFDKVVSVKKEMPSEVLEIATHRGRKTKVTVNHPFYQMYYGKRRQDLTHIYDWLEAEKLQEKDRIAIALGWPVEYKSNCGITETEAWALGAWAGDGDCTKFRFINPDKPVIDKLRRFIQSIGGDLKSTYSTRQK